MKRIIKKLFGVLIASVGLSITYGSMYVIAQRNPSWLDWFGIALVGVGITIAGIVLTIYGFKKLVRAVVFFFTSFPDLF